MADNDKTIIPRTFVMRFDIAFSSLARFANCIDTNIATVNEKMSVEKYESNIK